MSVIYLSPIVSFNCPFNLLVICNDRVSSLQKRQRGKSRDWKNFFIELGFSQLCLILEENTVGESGFSQPCPILEENRVIKCRRI